MRIFVYGFPPRSRYGRGRTKVPEDDDGSRKGTRLQFCAAGGLPSLARQGLTFLSLICLNNIASRYGDATVASFSVASRVLRFNCLSFPLCGLIIVSNMFLQNIRKTRDAVLVASARQGLFFIPAVLIGNIVAGKSGLVAAQAISDVFAFALCVPLFIRAYRGLR